MRDPRCRKHGPYSGLWNMGCPDCKSEDADRKRAHEEANRDRKRAAEEARNAREEAKRDQKRAREEAGVARYQAERDREQRKRDQERSREEAQERRRENDQRRNERQSREPRRSRQEEVALSEEACRYQQRQRDEAEKQESLKKEQKAKAEADRLVQEAIVKQESENQAARLEKEQEDRALAERMKLVRSPEERVRVSGYPPAGIPGYQSVGGGYPSFNVDNPPNGAYKSETKQVQKKKVENGKFPWIATITIGIMLFVVISRSWDGRSSSSSSKSVEGRYSHLTMTEEEVEQFKAGLDKLKISVGPVNVMEAPPHKPCPIEAFNGRWNIKEEEIEIARQHWIKRSRSWIKRKKKFGKVLGGRYSHLTMTEEEVERLNTDFDKLKIWVGPVNITEVSQQNPCPVKARYE